MRKKRLIALLLAGALLTQSGAVLAADIEISDEEITDEIVLDDGEDAEEVSEPTVDMQEDESPGDESGEKITIQSFTVQDSEIVDSGTCGDNLTWTLDAEGTLTISGEGAMMDDTGLHKLWPKNRREIKKVLIESGVTSIGESVFEDCNYLTSVTIPDSVTSIEEWAFYGCYALENVTIPNSVTSIGGSAFGDCDSITSITIPNSVTNIGYNAFWGCALRSICVTEGNAEYSSRDGVLYNKDETRLVQYPEAKNGAFTILKSVKSIEQCAFAGCKSLKSITIPNSVTSIEEWAFYGCYALENVTIPNSVTSIGCGTFNGCSSLKSVTIPNSVTSIGGRAFNGCSSLKSVTIPNSVTSIGESAFTGCRSLTSVTIQNPQCDIFRDSINSDTTIYGYSNSTAQAYAEKYNRKFVALDEQDKHTHTWDAGKVTKAATCKEAGIKTYTCKVCGKTKTETIAKTAHTYKTTTIKAKPGANGSIVTKCTVCGDVKSNTAISAPKTLTLSKTSYVYNGKAQKPTVTVKDANGNAIAASNYTVSYPSGRKNVGVYKVTVTFKGDKYTGSLNSTFTINPKTTTLKSVTAASKGFTAKWTKQATQTTGYELQYSTSSKFTGAKTVTISKNKTVSKKVTKLTAKKKYFVRIRTYKTVRGKKYYSAWSKAKTVTTKK